MSWVSQGLSGRDSVCNAGELGQLGPIPGSGRFPGGEHGNPLQYSRLENPLDRGALVHGVIKSTLRDVTSQTEFLANGLSLQLYSSQVKSVPWPQKPCEIMKETLGSGDLSSDLM